MKILVIEDDENIVDYIVNIFQIAWPKAEVLNTPTGKKGIDFVLDEHPDAVLLDLGLPDIDGFEVLKEIRSFSNIPVIIVTGITKDFERFISTRKQVPPPDGYISKPIDQDEMLKLVEKLI